MTQWRTCFGALAAAVLLALAGCGGGEAAVDGDAATGGGETTAGGETAGGETTNGGETTATAGAAATPEIIAAGGERFEAVCGLCHPGGDEDDGPSLRNIHWDVERVRTQVRNGSDHMRPVSTARMSDADLEKVFAWLRTIGTIQ